MRIARALAALALVALGSAFPAGCSGGVVGGECRQGFTFCGGRCVDFQSDSENCGACGLVCADGVSCVDGGCGKSRLDGGGIPDSGHGGSVGVDGSSSGGAGGSGGAGVDGGSGGSSSGGSAGAGGTLLDAGTGGAVFTDGGGLVDGGGTVSTGGAGGTGAGGVASGGAGGAGAGGVASGGAGGTGAGGIGAGGTGAGGTGAGGAPQCTGPLDIPSQCGACGVVCQAPFGLCSPGNDGYQCTALCTAPLVQCGSQCVNTDTDENNCGRCGKVCVSQICQGGQCVGATAGNEVTLCMDYRTKPAAGSPQQRLLGNAVFLPTTEPLRAMFYVQYTPTTTRSAVLATLDAAATARGRTYTPTNATTPLQVTNQLNVVDFDTLVIEDQPNAPAGTLATVGTSFASTISSFVRAGGTVVVLAGDGGTAEMPAFLLASGILDVASQTTVTGNLLYNRAPGDAVGLNVLSQFRGVRETCTFALNTVDPAATFVITDQPVTSGTLGAPVVVHQVIAP